MCPISQSDGHDFPRHLNQLVPSLAAFIDDIGIGRKDPIGEPVLAHELPDVFDGIQFGTARRQREKADVFGDIELA